MSRNEGWVTEWKAKQGDANQSQVVPDPEKNILTAIWCDLAGFPVARMVGRKSEIAPNELELRHGMYSEAKQTEKGKVGWQSLNDVR